MTGSWSIVDRWDLSRKHVLRYGIVRSALWKPRPFRSSSMVSVLVEGSAERALSWGRTVVSTGIDYGGEYVWSSLLWELGSCSDDCCLCAFVTDGKFGMVSGSLSGCIKAGLEGLGNWVGGIGDSADAFVRAEVLCEGPNPLVVARVRGI